MLGNAESTTTRRTIGAMSTRDRKNVSVTKSRVDVSDTSAGKNVVRNTATSMRIEITSMTTITIMDTTTTMNAIMTMNTSMTTTDHTVGVFG